MSAHFVSGLFRDGYSKRLCTGISMGSCGMHRILLAHPHSITLRQRFPINWRNCKISCTTAKKDRVRESVRPFPVSSEHYFKNCATRLNTSSCRSGVGVLLGLPRRPLFCWRSARVSSVIKLICSSVRPSTETTAAFSPQAR